MSQHFTETLKMRVKVSEMTSPSNWTKDSQSISVTSRTQHLTIKQTCWTENDTPHTTLHSTNEQCWTANDTPHTTLHSTNEQRWPANDTPHTTLHSTNEQRWPANGLQRQGQVKPALCSVSPEQRLQDCTPRRKTHLNSEALHDSPAESRC